MHWKLDHTDEEWDAALADLNGHPLQSALWGKAKKAVYGITDQRMALYCKNNLAALFRVENRGPNNFLKLAWMPQGPTLSSHFQWENIEKNMLEKMELNGASLCIILPWKTPADFENQKQRQTIWIDLELKKEKLWSALDKQWRYGVRSAHRSGVQMHIATTHQEVSDFYNLCITVSQKKTFDFQHKQQFLQYLIDYSDHKNVGAKLFLAKHENTIVAGAFILCSGKNVHYMWGAVDRKYAKLRAGEFIQWAVIEWACEHNYMLYDLEGIDEVKNPGVAAFKKKMGGEIISLSSSKVYEFNFKGRLYQNVTMPLV